MVMSESSGAPSVPGASQSSPDSPDNVTAGATRDTREAPLWRLPEVAEALTEASDAWSNGPAAALGPLRRANRLLQTSGHADWALQGERLVQAIAEAAYGGSGSQDAQRNALRQFERDIWQAGVVPAPLASSPSSQTAATADNWAGAPTPGELRMAGWVIAQPRLHGLPAGTAPLRADVERVLLRLLRPDADATDTTAALGQLADLAADLHRAGATAPLDYWRLAAAWLRFARAPLSLADKRQIGRMNMALRKQLTRPSGPDDVRAAPATSSAAARTAAEAVPGHDLLEALATWHAEAPDTWLGTLLADFGVLRRPSHLPEPLADAAQAGQKQGAGTSSRDWLRIGPLSVRQDVCQTFLSLADEALPNLNDPAVAAQVAQNAAAIGLAPVARLAAAVAATGERLAASPPAEPGGPAALAMTVRALRGMLHQFAADTYPEARPDLIAEMAMWRERALDASVFGQRLVTGRDVP
ncbi:response regulator receiver:CheW-like protein:ATP-binding region, ATPase-like:Hpt [Pandoraea capi]|uniref:Response regulator receiver:CheW-like protein:ATP-binding region, ATPase-like:Hpt n=2 Tax=Pandoraea capi TaxID=2508286 RepID=A0ABY6VNQ9_9BURK|nr:response regulator receiver:CheW-like protein:ATP-binding region, ATPase-like:Hpt [Pandoraea capi]